jgi:predicted nucleic acid-binding protein
MKPVVCDTGPVNYLIQIEDIEVLNHLFTPVFLPQACHLELLQPKAPVAVREWASQLPGWMSSLEANPDPGVSAAGLSHADTEVLVRAVERNAVVLMDDLSGRNHAKSLGLRVIGTLGVVELAARRQLLSLREAISRLQQTNIRISEDLYRQVIERNQFLR